MLKYKKIKGVLYYTLGIFITFLCLKIKGISISLFPYFLIVVIGSFKFIKNFKIYKFSKLLLFYYINIILSLFVGVYYGIDNFKVNLFTIEIFKILTFLFLLIFLKIKKYEIKKFYEGIKFGIFINLIWASLELILWNLEKISLNEVIFGKVLEYNVGHTWLNTKFIFNYEMIRVCGFAWDPSFLGMLSALGVFIFKNKYLKFYSLFILLNTYSRSGQVALIFTFLSIKFITKLKKINYKKIIQLIIVIILGVSIVNYFIGTTKNSHIGDKRRVQYYFSAIESTYINKNIFLFLWGGSPFKTGNPLYLNKSLQEKTLLSKNMTVGWRIESDWAGILTGRGWINFLLYLYIHIYVLFACKNKELKNITMIFLFAGIGYTYENSIIINLFLIYFYNNFKRRKNNERNNISRRKWNKTLSNNKSNIKTDKSYI